MTGGPHDTLKRSRGPQFEGEKAPWVTILFISQLCSVQSKYDFFINLTIKTDKALYYVIQLDERGPRICSQEPFTCRPNSIGQWTMFKTSILLSN